MKHLALFFLWFGYGLLHSMLATTRVKSFLTTRFSLKEKYRLFYNILATLLLVALLAYQFSLPSEALWTNSSVERILGLTTFLGGIHLLRVAFRSYNSAEFLGLKTTENDFSELRQDGLLQYVRHPLYSATLLLLWGAFLIENTRSMLTMSLALTLYLFLGIYWEEKKLVAAHGDAYRAYRKRVPMLIPPLL